MKFIYNTQADDLKLSFFNFLTNILFFQRIPHNDKILPEKFHYIISLGMFKSPMYETFLIRAIHF